MAVEIGAMERDALFRRVLIDLATYDDLKAAVEAGDLEQSYRLGRIIADAFRLVVDGGLGWAHRTAEPTALTLPPAELRRIITRLRADAEADYESSRPQREEAQKEWGEITDARDACTAVLQGLGS